MYGYRVDEHGPQILASLQETVTAFNAEHGTTWAVDVDVDGTCRVGDSFSKSLALLDFKLGRPLPATAQCAARLWNTFVGSGRARA